MKDIQRSANAENTKLWLFWLVVGVICLMWALSPYLVENFFAVDSVSPLNVSDVFAPVNALFSGLAFACFAYTVYMQRIELGLTREELRLQREETAATRLEIQGQKEQAILQNSTLSRQAFENTFFQLLTQHAGILSEMTVSEMGTLKKGRQCFIVGFERLVQNYNNIQSSNQIPIENLLKTTCENMKPAHQQQFGHYMRSLHALYEFVDNGDINNKVLYANFISSQLSSPELSILMYTIIFDKNYSRLKALVEKYGILKELTQFDVVERSVYLTMFEPSAFG
jgi:hypothetical protein